MDDKLEKVRRQVANLRGLVCTSQRGTGWSVCAQEVSGAVCAQEVSGVASTARLHTCADASHDHEVQERLRQQREMIDELEKSSPLNVAKVSISSIMLEKELQRLEREVDFESVVPQEDMGVEVCNVMGVQTAENTFYKEHILQGEQAAAMEQQPVEEEGEAVETRRLSIARIMLENERKRAAILPSSNHAAPWDARYVTVIQPTSREPASLQPEAEMMAHFILPGEDTEETFFLLEQEQETVTEELEMLESEINSLYRARRPQGEQDRAMQRTDAVR